MSETGAEFLDRLEATPRYNPAYRTLDSDRLFALARRGAAVQWRPIEEAPKDGTPILLLIQFPGEPPHIITALWDGRVPKWPWRPVGGSSAYSEEYATHWMPLPPPPAGETSDE